MALMAIERKLAITGKDNSERKPWPGIFARLNYRLR